MTARIGAVAIGRNEGARLKVCLRSLIGCVDDIVYVDSGSSDGSVELARSLGVDAIALKDGPFTAARGRQVGFDRLLERNPRLESVQFVDGDCALEAGWIDEAAWILEGDSSLAAVTGRRVEMRCAESMWSRIVDVDWHAAPGESDVLGGDSLIRAEALRGVGGWCTTLIAGEDPELAFRFIDNGWRIRRLDREMSRHDIAMTNFREYWRRHVRAGHAYAEVARMHWRGAGARWARRVAGILVYGTVLPVMLLFGAVLYWPAAAAALLMYLILILRLTVQKRREREGLFTAFAYGVLTTFCKVANAIGVLGYYVRSLFGWRRGLIEYRVRRPVSGKPTVEQQR